ncbi:MAG: hypothetical protein IT368_02350 [Candidatus Hydrogenedentes bacterium]|nr:hypothetical protein [Candidatus Hydrogenedentota bacterium]
MARKKIMFGVGAGVISLGVDGLSSLLILRLLTAHLSAEEAGYWILVTSAGSLLLLLQCGLGPTIARAVAGLTVGGDQESQRQMLGAVRSAFGYIAATVALAAVVIHFTYLWPTARAAGLNWKSALSWFPYALGMAANLQGQSSLFVLNGHGEVGWDKVFRSLFTVLGFGAVWVTLLWGGELPALGFIYLGQNLLFWLVAELKLKSYLGASADALPARPGQIRALFHEGSKLLLLNLLTFLITQFTIFIVERRFGLKEVVSYAAMLRVGVLIGTIGSLLPQMLYPYVARAWAAHDYAKCRRYYVSGVVVAVGTALAISLPLYLFGREIFTLWLGDKVPYAPSCFAAVLGFYVLYVYHAANATPALAVAGDAFTLPAITNAVLVLILVFALSSAWGMIGVPVGMILGTLPASVYVVMRSWRIIMHPSKVPDTQAAK